MNRDILKRIIARRHAALCNFSRRYTKTFSRKGNMNAGMPVNFGERFRFKDVDPSIQLQGHDLVAKAGQLKPGKSSFGDTEISDTGLKRAEVHNALVAGNHPQGIETAEDLMNVIRPYGDPKQNLERIEAPRNLYPSLFELATGEDLSGVDFENTSLEDLIRRIPKNKRSKELQQVLTDSEAAGLRPDVPFKDNESPIFRAGEVGDYLRFLNGLKSGNLSPDDIKRYVFVLNRHFKNLSGKYKKGSFFNTDTRDDSHVGKESQLTGNYENQAAEIANLIVPMPGFKRIPNLVNKGSHGFKNLSDSAQPIITFMARNRFGK